MIEDPNMADYKTLEADNERLREALRGIDSVRKRLRIDQGRGLDAYVRAALVPETPDYVERGPSGATYSYPRYSWDEPTSPCVCECGHTDYWHSHSGEGDCEFNAVCTCLAFREARDE